MSGSSDRRGLSIGETSLTVKWSFVLVAVVGIYGWFFLCSLDHEKRITAQETGQKYILENITDIKTTVTAIREDQKNYYIYQKQMEGKNERARR